MGPTLGMDFGMGQAEFVAGTAGHPEMAGDIEIEDADASDLTGFEFRATL